MPLPHTKTHQRPKRAIAHVSEATNGANGAGEVVVLTGASAGVGRATAIAFARKGARVALLARGRAGLEAAAADVQAAGGEALVLPTDVADPAQVEAAADAVEREWGPIDVGSTMR